MQVHSGSFWPQEFWKTSFFYTTAIFHKSPLTLLPVLWWGEVRRDGAPVRFEEHTSFSLKRNFFFFFFGVELFIQNKWWAFVRVWLPVRDWNCFVTVSCTTAVCD